MACHLTASAGIRFVSLTGITLRTDGGAVVVFGIRGPLFGGCFAGFLATFLG